MPYYRCAACGLTSYSAPAHNRARVCPTCSASLGDGARVYVMPGATHTVKRALAARPEAAAEARREVVGLPLDQDAREQLALLVSELVNNAVLHAAAPGAPVRLEIRVRSDRARIEVGDSGQGFDPPVPVGRNLLTDGGGLPLVAAIAETWGVRRRRGGCTVWCELSVAEPAHVVEHEASGAYVRELATAGADAPAP